jgi:predicted histone-like DNA-binding protein
MSLMYKVSACKSRTTSAYGKFYAHSVYADVVDTTQLAGIMQRNCTLKKSDIKAVLTELVDVMRDELQASNIVRLDGFGSFRLAMHSNGVAKKEDFKVSDIMKVKCIFSPASTQNSDHKRVREFCNDVSLIYMDLPDGGTAAAASGGEANS